MIWHDATGKVCVHTYVTRWHTPIGHFYFKTTSRIHLPDFSHTPIGHFYFKTTSRIHLPDLSPVDAHIVASLRRQLSGMRCTHLELTPYNYKTKQWCIVSSGSEMNPPNKWFYNEWMSIELFGAEQMNSVSFIFLLKDRTTRKYVRCVMGNV